MPPDPETLPEPECAHEPGGGCEDLRYGSSGITVALGMDRLSRIAAPFTDTRRRA
jgi:hypothetical protein